MARLIAKFLDDDSGATAIEYCLIAAGISIMIITAVNGIGGTLNTGFTSLDTARVVAECVATGGAEYDIRSVPEYWSFDPASELQCAAVKPQ